MLRVSSGSNFQSNNAPIELHLSEQFDEYTSSDDLQLDINAVTNKTETHKVL